ncbi:MAG TPA: GDSL-type esterase/lipase family protein [Rugosimonospora sp.]|nr:GDSL-type esterase/lipase family protein [Rugosimonospora sp.]
MNRRTVLAALAGAPAFAHWPAELDPGPGPFSFDVPPGTYRVSAALGSRAAAAQTGLQVEARRTVLATVDTAAGEVRHESVTVNVRTPESMPTGEEGPGTPGLQVYLTGGTPALAGLRVTPEPGARQLFIVSDSTASDWLVGPKRGWGQEFPQLFRAGLSIANYADSGESTVSWLADPTLFATVQPLVRPGDEVLIQLAHNDKTTPEDVYRANLGTLIDGVRARQGRPVLVTPPVRHLFAADGTLTPTGRVVNNLGVDLPAVLRDVAARQGIPLLDLTARSQALLESLGPDGSWSLYLTVAHDGVQDASHFSGYGATVMAGLVAGEMRRVRLPAAGYLRQPC